MVYLKDSTIVAPPERLRMPDGSTRTDSSTFTEAELQLAGYAIAPDMPTHNTETQYCEWVGSAWVVLDKPPPEPPEYEWFIDIGPFFDRFKDAKLQVLTFTHPFVVALVKDTQARKWIDLKRSDVAVGLNAMLALGVPQLTTELIQEILNTPVSEEENFALKKLFFNT